jgi:hypothetical protein
MRELLNKILAIVGLMGCGEKADTGKIAALDINPANLPVRSECLGLDVTHNHGVPVDWDDQTPLRVCLVQQADGALAFDIRLRTDRPAARRQAMNVEVRGVNGRSAGGVFPLLWNPFNGIYELQLSQGCLVGTPDGCAVTAPSTMRHLFSALPHAEGSWHPEVRMNLSLVQDEGKSQPDSPRFSFYWPSSSTELEKNVY